MAAYAALVSLMHIIHDIQHHHSPPISLNKQQVESLTEIVTFLQDFLEGYNSPFDYSDEADPLEIRIADAAYAAEDVIESHILAKIQLSRSKISRLLNWFRGLRNILMWSVDDERTNLYQDVQQVIEEMDLIKRVGIEKAMVHHQLRRKSSATAASLVSYASCVQNNTMVCSNDVLHGIMEKLAGGRLHRQVIPIVGMGGIGKTTLARNIYAQPLIKEYFDISAWATISQQYNTREILCELVSEATKKRKEELSERSEDELGLELYKCLFGRRFLIVLDDMWNIDAWENLQCFFPNNENGSRILVTTRLWQLSSQLNNNYSYQMELLDEVSSWDLFSKIVFGEESCPLELKDTGEKIVQNCRGLPLSIVVVGGLLKKMEHTQGCWKSIWDNFASVVNMENDSHCLKILRMSYNSLPVHLKPCFLYMGVFEEDEEICVSKLIKHWVSEGFIKPMNGKSLGTIAKEFLEDLVDRNLILVEGLGCTGNIKYCKIHDLLRDMCLRESQKYGFYHVIGQHSPQGINSRRRIVISRSTSKKNVLDALQSMSHARSVAALSVNCKYGEIPRCQDLGLLRTLRVCHDYLNESNLNALVFECLNLQHLTVEVGSMSSFLSSINLLWNLHTLIVTCRVQCSAPVGIWKMPQFRHIEFILEPLYLPDPPSSDVIMENLQILKGVANFKCGDEVVKRIPNVRKLGISYNDREAMDDRSDDDDYCLSNVKCLSKLEALHVVFDCNQRGVALMHNKLTFPNSLKILHFAMRRDLRWEDVLEKIGSLPHLQKLIMWEGCFLTGKWEIIEGQFPSLKHLSLIACRNLEQWTAQESSIFPCLEYLRLHGLLELKEIPSQIGDIPTLQRVHLHYCSESVVMCVKDIVDEQVELQGEQLPFHVTVRAWSKDEALQTLAGPNFHFYY